MNQFLQLPWINLSVWQKKIGTKQQGYVDKSIIAADIDGFIVLY